MTTRASPRLNDSGEEGITRVVQRGALHFSRGQSTRHHAHNAWKMHIGLDAPVWIDNGYGHARASDGPRVVVVPPNTSHATGALGWSVAVFVEPGSRGTRWSADQAPFALPARQARRILDACRRIDPSLRGTAAELIDAVAAEIPTLARTKLDPRVEEAIEVLRNDPDINLACVAELAGLSLDRLSRLVHQQTGLTLRRHRLWVRLTGALSLLAKSSNIADAAIHAGFSDHAHMTRTFRAFLGRAPSDFSQPPDVLQPW